MVKKRGKKGFLEETPVQLILLLMSFVVVAMILGSIFAGAGIMNKLCQAVPWLCGSYSAADEEISKQSTNALACAIGSVFTGTKWEGSGDYSCDEFYSNTSSSSDGSGKITGAAAAEEKTEDKEITIDDARKLQPSVACSDDGNGNTKCTVKNFVMPQKVVDAEEWIAFWGDPDYLVYWSSFPEEEDTWNFEVKWVHHVVIAGLAIFPLEKAIGLGFRTISTAVRGPSQKFLAKESANILMKEAETAVIEKGLYSSTNYWAAKNVKKIIPDTEIQKVLGIADLIKKGGLDKKTEQTLLEESAKTFSKLKKSELKEMFDSAEISMGKGKAISILMKDSLKDMFQNRLQKIIAKKGLTGKIKTIIGEVTVAGGEIAGGEALLAALAESTMKIYEPVGNALAISKPGNKKEGIKVYELPKEMEGKPVVIKWDAEGGDTQIKHAHFASPCYLKEFEISKVDDEITCGNYNYNFADKSIRCKDVKINKNAPLMCGSLENAKYTLNSKTAYDTYDNVISILNAKDKKIFEVDENQTLKKIYLPWLSTEKSLSWGSSSPPQFYINDIKYKESSWLLAASGGGSGSEKKDLVLGEELSSNRMYDYSEYYDATLSCDDCSSFKVVSDQNEIIMSPGSSYIAYVYYLTDSHGVAIDIYSAQNCKNMVNFAKPSDDPYMNPVFSCDNIKSGKTPTYATPYEINDKDTLAQQIEKIKEKITSVNTDKNDNGFYITITPVGNIKAGDVNALSSDIKDCADDPDSKNCFRVLSELSISTSFFECGTKEKQPQLSTFYETCIIKIPEIEKLFGYESGVGGWVDPETIKISRHAIYDENAIVTEIAYSDLTIQPLQDFYVGFADTSEDDDNILWDSLSLTKTSRGIAALLPECIKSDDTSFKIQLSGIQDDGKYTSIDMENCRTDGILISFKNNDFEDSKIKVDEPNYCLRWVGGTARIADYNLFCGISAKNIVVAAATVAGTLVTGGWGTALFVTAALAEAGTDINKELERIWPGDRGL